LARSSARARTGPTQGGDCYWARLKTPHGGDTLDDIIENGIGGGSQTVQLNEGEWFEVANCGEWQKIG
jgi:hypothetical protein